MKPLFSILVAAYNQDRYIVETLDSVAAQTFHDYELVVVDDGSTDRTEVILADWVERYRHSHPNRVVVETTPNRGQSAALERAFELASGRYICLLDSDDRWVPGKLAAIAAAVEEDPEAGMLMHPLYVIDPEGRRTGDVRPKRAQLPTGDLRDRVRRTLRLAAPATSGVVIRSDVFDRLVPMPTKRFKTAADLYLTLGAGLLEPVRSLAEPLAEYRMHPDGQHIRTMLSADGVRYWVELQSAIAESFGLRQAARRNAYFLRQDFALAKLEGSLLEQVKTYLELSSATWTDHALRIRDRILFNSFWAVCLIVPRTFFRGLWRTYQLKQTGFDRIRSGASVGSGHGTGGALYATPS